MNGKLFLNFNKLNKLYLRGNECVNQNFLKPTALALAPQLVSDFCGFCKSNSTIETQVCEIGDQLQEDLDINFEKLLDGQKSVYEELWIIKKSCSERVSELLEVIKIKTDENSHQLNTIAHLEEELATFRATETESRPTTADNKIVVIEIVYEKLVAQKNKLFQTQLQELRKAIQVQASKINELELKNQFKTVNSSKDQCVG